MQYHGYVHEMFVGTVAQVVASELLQLPPIEVPVAGRTLELLEMSIDSMKENGARDTSSAGAQDNSR